MKSATDLKRPDAFSILPAESGQKAVAINPFIYQSYGNSNSYMLLTETSRVIINTGMGYESKIHKQAFDAISTAPTSHIILTQGHVDHVGGVAHFREPGTQLIAQRSNSICQQDDARITGIRSSRSFIFFAEAINRAITAIGSMSDVPSQDIPTPDVVFDDSLKLEIGGLELELYSVAGGETVDSLIIWLPQQRIVFTGNQFGPLFPHFPNFYTIRGDKYRFAQPYLESLERVRALKPHTMITGHYEPVSGEKVIDAELTRLRDAVQWVHDKTLEGLNAGKDYFQLMQEIKLPPELQVGEGYGRVSWAVRAICESYLGWFRMKSTSEIYATPPEACHADLAELAGADRLIERGQQLLERDQVIQAIQLAEIAAAGEPDSDGVRKLLIACHRRLLTLSNRENFWEVRWLEHQLQKLQPTDQA